MARKLRDTLPLAELLGVEETPEFPLLQAGDVVEKIGSEPGDAHDDGHRGTVVEPFSPPATGLPVPQPAGPVIAYFVLWEGEERPNLVGAYRLRLVERPPGSVDKT